MSTPSSVFIFRLLNIFHFDVRSRLGTCVPPLLIGAAFAHQYPPRVRSLMAAATSLIFGILNLFIDFDDYLRFQYPRVPFTVYAASIGFFFSRVYRPPQRTTRSTDNDPRFIRFNPTCAILWLHYVMCFVSITCYFFVFFWCLACRILIYYKLLHVIGQNLF